jgi:hypothetical protein
MCTGMGDKFTIGLLIGGFLLASWVDSRVGDGRPAATMRRIYHALAGLIVLQLSLVGLSVVHAVGASEPLVMVAVFALFLPALVYALLTALWVMRSVAELPHSTR